ncbi:MAG: acyl-CoA thioesterase [Gemmobacter sp.]
MSYLKVIPIEFNHCDPAGIVFYPRYFEMTNSVVENFFADVVGYSFARMHGEGARNGVPTVRIACEFRAASRLGERLPFRLQVVSVGRSSLGLKITARMGEELRLSAEITLVWIDNGRAAPWPAEVRERLMEALAEDARDDRQPA